MASKKLDVVAKPDAAPQTADLMPASEVIEQAKSNGDNRSITSAAVLLSGYPAAQLDDAAREWIKVNAVNVKAFDTAADAHRETMANAYKAAQSERAAADAMLCAFAYGVTKVSKVMTGTALATDWGLFLKSGKPNVAAITAYATAGKLRSQAKLDDATTMKLRGLARDGKTGIKDLTGKTGSIETKAITAIMSDPKVDTPDKLKAALKKKITPAKPRSARPNADGGKGDTVAHADTVKAIFDLTKIMVSVNKGKLTLPDSVDDVDGLTGYDAARNLHSVLGAYLSRANRKDATPARKAAAKKAAATK